VAHLCGELRDDVPIAALEARLGRLAATLAVEAESRRIGTMLR
jgi:hypothetical protein